MNLYQKILDRNEKIALVGLGYVGMPIAVAFAKKGIEVVGFDLNKSKIELYKKGIPVGIFDEDGKFEQIAEVESNELILSLENTKQIEEYKNSYDESKEDSFAIDCGKFLVEQLFKNTEDPNKVIKNTN